MKISVNGKVVTIPDKEIKIRMTKLELTKEEAIRCYLEDEKILINKEQEALDKKARDSGILRTIHDAREVKEEKPFQQKTQKERVKKANPTKSEIIKNLYNVISEFAETAKISNPEKLILFKYGDNYFKLDLIQATAKTQEKIKAELQ